MAWTTKTTGTRHNADCKMTFGRKDANCPRCQELLAGDKPRAGYNDARIANDKLTMLAIRNHNCKSAGCGSVCTFGDF